MSKPTPEQVKAEVEKLKELKGKVRAFTAFREDNTAAIQAQIDVLTGELDTGSDEFDELSDYEQSNAHDAERWLDEGPDEDGSLSDQWATLVP